jgi:protein TonB
LRHSPPRSARLAPKLALLALLAAAPARAHEAREVVIRPVDAAWARPLPAPAEPARISTPLATGGADPLAHLPLRPRLAGAEPPVADAPGPRAPVKFRREKVEVALPPPAPAPIEQAETVDAPPPEYPRTARRLRQEGTATLLADVDGSGAVVSCRVETSSGFPLLDQAALAVLPTWRFKPRLVSGKAQPFVARVPFRFSMPR